MMAYSMKRLNRRERNPLLDLVTVKLITGLPMRVSGPACAIDRGTRDVRISEPSPIEQQTWRIRLGSAGAQAICEFPRQGLEFAPNVFAYDPNWLPSDGRDEASDCTVQSNASDCIGGTASKRIRMEFPNGRVILPISPEGTGNYVGFPQNTRRAHPPNNGSPVGRTGRLA